MANNTQKKYSDGLKKAIQWHLTHLATKDALFAPNLIKPGKNIDECCAYIINTVKETGQCGFSDDEIYSMAVHYYQEDNIKVDKPAQCRVVVNHTIELTEEEKKQARQKAIKQAQEKAFQQITTKGKSGNSPKNIVPANNKQTSLFEL